MIDPETVYIQYKQKVLGYLVHRMNSLAAAEDLCSEVFLKVTAGLDRFDPAKSSLSTWVYTITRNTLYDYFRTHREHAEPDENLAAPGDFTEALCNSETLEALAEALKALPDRERELIVRRYYYGESLKDIRARFGLSYSYTKLLHQNALEKIRVFLEKQ